MFRYIVCFLLVSGSLAVSSQVVINEYSCSNISTIPDANFNYEDWIELYNTGSSPVSIGGWYLTDDAADLQQYTIPALTIAAGGRQLFFASGNNTATGGEYHTNFKLTQSTPEKIILSNSSGAVVDSLTLKPTQTDHSRGRTADGATTWSVFTFPTPDAANANPKQEYAAKPTMSVAAGFYPSAQTVSISAVAGLTIHYTLDGSQPTTSSPTYSAPLTISTTKLVRAASFSSDPSVPQSFYDNNTYFINTNHALPVVSLGSDEYQSSLFGGGQEIRTSIELFGKNQQQMDEGDGDMESHGNDSWAFDQKGMHFKSRDSYGYDNDIDYPLFRSTPRNDYKLIIFKNAGNDNYPGYAGGSPVWFNDYTGQPLPGCHLRDAFSQTLSMKGCDLDERSYEPCVIYINGQYWGLYEMRERVDEDFAKEYYGTGESKVDRLSYWGVLTIENGSDTAWTALHSYVMANNMAVAANYQHVTDRMDVLSLIDYFVFNTFTMNGDWLNWNTQWWRGRGGDSFKWRYHLWDMDNTFALGQDYTGLGSMDCNVETVCTAQDLFNGQPGIEHTDFYKKLLDNPDFSDLYANRYADLFNTVLNLDTMLHHLDSLVALISPEMPQQIARWGGSIPEWQANLDFLRQTIICRHNVIQQQVVDCLELTGPYSLTVFIDPPQAGKVKINTISPNSFPWTGEYFGDVQIRLEAQPNTGWSFVNYLSYHSTFAPSQFSDTVTFPLTQNDTIILTFKDFVQVQGINDAESYSGFSLFPNPADNVLNILSTNIQEFMVQIFNLSGNLVMEKKNLISERNKLDISGLANGLYFVCLSPKNGRMSMQKLVRN